MSEMNTCAPVIIPTLCRYEHFKRCVESLSRCKLSDRTELFIGLDYPAKESHWEGYRKIKDFLPTIEGFAKVVIEERKENFGPARNFESLVELVVKDHDTYIISEDDNEFSPNFLEYINKGLSKYKYDDRVLTINGYNYPINMNGYDNNIYCSYGYSAWGVGIWRDKEQVLNTIVPSNRTSVAKILKSPTQLWRIWKREPRIVGALINCYNRDFYGDTIYVAYSILNNKVSIFPSVSKVRNYGHDGSGRSMSYMQNDIYLNQRIDDSSSFEYDDIEIEDTKLPSYTNFFDIGVRGRMSIIKNYLRWFFFR